MDSVLVSDEDPLIEAHVSPNGELVYVAVDFDASLSVVRTSDLQVVVQIPFYFSWWARAGGGGGGRMVCSPSGDYVYANLYRGDYLAVVRTADEVVVDSLFLGVEDMPSVAISPDGKRLFLAVDDPRSIVAVRLPDNVVEDTISTLGAYSYVSSMKVAPDGTRLYVVDEGSGRVCSIRLSDKSIEWQVSGWGWSEGPGAIVVHPTGNPLYVLQDGFISVRESGTGSLIDSIAVSSFWNSDISPDGSFLYVTCSGSNDSGAVAVVRTSDNKVVRVIAMPAAVYDVAPSPDGKRLYAACDNGELYVLSR
jgi:DNA-binding beta-propeller fold protein YncE